MKYMQIKSLSGMIIARYDILIKERNHIPLLKSYKHEMQQGTLSLETFKTLSR